MNVAAMSFVMNQSKLAQAVSVQVMQLASNVAEQHGQELVQMMAQSVQPHLGQHIDVSI